MEDFREGLQSEVPDAGTPDMLKVNMSMHTIRLHHCYSKHELFQRSVIPYLERNRVSPRHPTNTPNDRIVLAVLDEHLSARTDVNHFWMLCHQEC
jgi:hypothetical protein